MDIFRNKKLHGYTLFEVLIAILVLGALAALAVPNYGTTLESFRSRDGVLILTALLQAQFDADADVADGRITTYNMAYIGVNIPASNNFDPPTLRYDGATFTPVTINAVSYNVYARAARTGGAYVLYIQGDGTILCDTNPICQKMGYAPW